MGLSAKLPLAEVTALNVWFLAATPPTVTVSETIGPEAADPSPSGVASSSTHDFERTEVGERTMTAPSAWETGRC